MHMTLLTLVPQTGSDYLKPRYGVQLQMTKDFYKTHTVLMDHAPGLLLHNNVFFTAVVRSHKYLLISISFYILLFHCLRFFSSLHSPYCTVLAHTHSQSHNLHLSLSLSFSLRANAPQYPDRSQNTLQLYVSLDGGQKFTQAIFPHDAELDENVRRIFFRFSPDICGFYFASLSLSLSL
jgi:hypothetical protein